MFIAIPENLKNNAVNISPEHFRIQSIIVSFNNKKIMLVNAYLPTDPQTQVFDDAKLLEVLEEIRSLIQNHDFDYFCLLGDLNADFSRNSGHVKTIRRFKEELNLGHSWENFGADFSHVHELNGMTYVSLIDHLMWNMSLGELVSDSGVLQNKTKIYV